MKRTVIELGARIVRKKTVFYFAVWVARRAIFQMTPTALDIGQIFQGDQRRVNVTSAAASIVWRAVVSPPNTAAATIHRNVIALRARGVIAAHQPPRKAHQRRPKGQNFCRSALLF